VTPVTTTDSFCTVAGHELLGPGDDYHVRVMVERYVRSLQGTSALRTHDDPPMSIGPHTAKH
jgi:hypothetical protein